MTFFVDFLQVLLHPPRHQTSQQHQPLIGRGIPRLQRRISTTERRITPLRIPRKQLSDAVARQSAEFTRRAGLTDAPSRRFQIFQIRRRHFDAEVDQTRDLDVVTLPPAEAIEQIRKLFQRPFGGLHAAVLYLFRSMGGDCYSGKDKRIYAGKQEGKCSLVVVHLDGFITSPEAGSFRGGRSHKISCILDEFLSYLYAKKTFKYRCGHVTGGKNVYLYL